tara:strand:- start:102 stop:854 length:753 start_codon:yes stop_codon:yes gene_type:complete
MAEVMSMIPDETPAGELNADEQESLQVGEQLEAQEEQRLAGKYKNAQELEAAYIELQKKLGEQPEAEEQVTEEPKEEEVSTESLLDQLWEQSKTEEYDEQTLKEIAKADPSELAKLYLEYRNKSESNTEPRMTQEYANSLREAVGGEKEYNQMLGWAGQNLTDQEIESYDAIMDKGDPAAAYWAVQALSYRYRDANGSEGDLVQGKAPSQGNGFRSQAELVQAMADPRYDRDPAYRQDVIKKLERSNVEF